MNVPSEATQTLLKKRTILILGEVSTHVQEEVCAQIFFLNSLSSDPIVLLIDSGGGSVQAEEYISDAIRLSRAPVHGIATGIAKSAAFGVLQACVLRAAYPHARLMFHAPAIGGIPIDQREKWKRAKKNLLRCHREQLEIFAKRSKQPFKKWKKWAKAERCFTAPQALRRGLIDEIITKPL